jgi:NAD(P)-dependent dehydrogenase (short-subunit alcohol dehydrogenase family)
MGTLSYNFLLFYKTVSTVIANRFQNKTVIVTGAGSGIGRAVVLRLVAEDASVLAIDVNETGLKETVQLTSHPERVSVAVISVTDEQQVTEKVNDYVARQGRLDALINIAGILRVTLSTESTLEQFRSVIDTNLVGTYLMCRVCLPHLLITKGNIINTASTAGLFGHPYMAAYASSKGAVIALTKSLAREYILQGVRVNAIAPGGIATPIHTSFEFPAAADLSLLAHLRTPNKQFGQPEQVAGVVAMLASQDGSFINGEVIRIDGGVHS